MIENQNGPDPIFAAGGPGVYISQLYGTYAQASLLYDENGNVGIGTSGRQVFFPNDEKNVYSAGAGFLEDPNVGELVEDCFPPQSYAQGLKGGRGKDHFGKVVEGGFGGGEAQYFRSGVGNGPGDPARKFSARVFKTRIFSTRRKI